MIYDGAGAPAYLGSVGFSRGVMRVFRGNDVPQSECIIDAGGLALVPGFIDAHSHGDLTLVSPYATQSKLSQGITPQIAGQCGVSLFPFGGDGEAQFTRFVSGIAPYPDLPERLSQLESAAGFYGWLESLNNPITTKCFVGHGTLRRRKQAGG